MLLPLFIVLKPPMHNTDPYMDMRPFKYIEIMGKNWTNLCQKIYASNILTRVLVTKILIEKLFQWLTK